MLLLSPEQRKNQFDDSFFSKATLLFLWMLISPTTRSSSLSSSASSRKPKLMSSQALDTREAVAFMDGISLGNLPAELPTSLRKRYSARIAQISQEVSGN